MAGSSEQRSEPAQTDAPVIVATRRLQRHWLQAHAERQRLAGRHAWPTPRVMTWPDWLAAAWRQYRNSGRGASAPLPSLLLPVQELALWEQLIRATASEELLNLAATARSAASSWRLLHDYELSLDALVDPDQDVLAWRSWARDFADRCREQGWISAAELPARLVAALPRGEWHPDPELRFAGFDSVTPAQQRLWQALRNNGRRITIENHITTPGALRQRPCQDPRDELVCAAQWARGLLESGTKGPIGVIVRDLEVLRDDAEHIFRSVLQPQDVATPAYGPPDLFHISLGGSLADYPLVADALCLLRWFRRPLPITTMARLLRSPFIRGSREELLERAELDARLRDNGWHEVSITGLLQYLQRSGRCPTLKECLRLAGESGPRSRSLAPGEWAEVFTEWLHGLGWPGTLSLDSAEYQTLSAWREVMSRFASIGLVLPTMNAEQAVGRLAHMAQSQSYQPLEDPAPVQILGLAEAPGLRFTHLWITGMSEDEWPPAPRPHPFLPVRAQSQAGIPGADAALALAQARTVSAALRSAAEDIVVSFPQQKLEQRLAISPLFADAASGMVATSAFPGAAQWLATRPKVQETFADHAGPPWHGRGPLRGGATAFQDQALCPFRGFASWRLHARGLPQLPAGIGAAGHGDLVHRCLAKLGRDLGDSGALHDRNIAQWTARVAEVVDQVMTECSLPPGRFDEAVWRLQRQRLTDLLVEWLQIERTRPPFAVRAVELGMTANFGGAQVKLQLDRIDDTESGVLVLDYKTGTEASTRAWFNERPEQPQLPMYALAYEQPVQGITFAWVRRGGCKFAGISAADTHIDGIKPLAGDDNNWPAQLSAWRAAMDTLGAEISAGWAAVAPKHTRACQTCDLQPLCRIYELGTAREFDDAP